MWLKLAIAAYAIISHMDKQEFYNKTSEEVIALVETSLENGLVRKQVESSRAINGANKLKIKGKPLILKIIEPFWDVFALMLVGAAILGFIKGDMFEVGMVAVILIINAGIYYYQQWSTGRVLSSLRKTIPQKVLVLRNGKRSSIDAEELVVGDIVFLSEGERVPADGRIVDESGLLINESILTGENEFVKKNPEVLQGKKRIYEQSNIVFSGTHVAGGTATIVVTAVGNNAEFGRIAKLVAHAATISPIQKKSSKLVSVIAITVLFFATFTVLLALWRGIELFEALRFALALIVSAVPEGMPIVIAILLALGMKRMASKKALVTNMRAIETIGAVNIIATDKTGTLTENRLTVQKFWEDLVTKSHLEKIYLAAAPKDTATDPLDVAMLKYTEDVKLSGKRELIRNYPFDQELTVSGNLWKIGNSIELYVKGAPENVLARCDISKKKRDEGLQKVSELGEQGYRVIALAKEKINDDKDYSDSDKLHLGNKLDFLGLICVADTVRSASQKAVQQALEAGVSVRMITGDHATTAYSVARSVGITENKEDVLDCRELDAMSKKDRVKTMKDTLVFARAVPENKYEILETLKKENIVAMTGDGVNDVPALRGAHVGVAMGSGSDMAQAAGDIILLDDNFKNIVIAVGEGRLTIYNVRRVMTYLLSTNLGEVLSALGGLIFFSVLPITPIQILWTNIVTDSLLSIPLGLEEAEEDLLREKPAPVNSPLLSRPIIMRLIMVSTIMAIIVLSTFTITRQVIGEEYAGTFAFVALVATQWANAIGYRSFKYSAFSRKKRINRKLIVMLAIAILMQAGVLFVWQPLLSIPENLPLMPLGIVIAVSLVIPMIAMEIQKKFMRKMTF